MPTNLMDKRAGSRQPWAYRARVSRLRLGGAAAQSEMPNRTSFSEVPAARVPRFGDSRRTRSGHTRGHQARISINEPKFINGAIDMGLAQELTLAEAVKPLTAFRYISFDVVGAMIDFESAIEDRTCRHRGRGWAVHQARLSVSLTDRFGERGQRCVLSGTALARRAKRSESCRSFRPGNASMNGEFPTCPIAEPKASEVSIRSRMSRCR